MLILQERGEGIERGEEIVIQFWPVSHLFGNQARNLHHQLKQEPPIKKWNITHFPDQNTF